MPSVEIVERFIARVEENEHVAAIEEFYTINASMQENQSEPRVGRDVLVANERKMLSNVKSIYSECIRPVFIKDNQAVIRWKFKFDLLDGTSMQIEEIAYQRWEDEYIAEEHFFYDPAQMIPK
ncbi:nuclear transport factor 2 family protein [Aquimarina sp. 2201CG5-10]|uniref:nuclear transport factor 2 family protein n=1 Tax=Aquimarina callyspongiae TaxID=3098150 RepID=UPI002AB45DD6|nr:nuclear transport factor 2 family protein [Aquimarina sp. 2201CG5-10]MDY8134474.1 nuclear transport factor 2 family protein [Aquimarina sp. 2201CG5-10]